ncbi:DUF616 domain-containing protein [Coraliomargarita algicola]|uniref:DUF616 domain-containing protein n=1 Tax=Coraliomargarita algicola TaxID=3092156 RepID=A0ABZ0RRE6_9BACT|nr:glycosyltransferase domain-containing protein [Coraliomargarita sp. J2-16]WPJ97738.1 DUF616 domain-containing protein [Coraliomargarita sp. J2-16]
MPRLAIYTAIIDQYDSALQPGFGEPTADVDYFCYTDNELPLPKTIERRLWKRKHRDATRDAREIKIQAFKDFKDYDWVVWIDANCTINATEIKHYLNEQSSPSHPIKVLAHDVRNCLYQEAQWAFVEAADSPARISHQINRYNEAGFPANFGLANTNLLIRKPTNPTAIHFSNCWLKQLSAGSRRDQLSFDFVRWQQNIQIDTIPGIWYDNRFCKRTTDHVRKAYRAPFHKTMITEWIRRILYADDLFHEVLYDHRGAQNTTSSEASKQPDSQKL